MTQFDSVETRRLTLVNNAGDPVVDFDIIANTAGEQARVRVKSRGHHSFEMWCEPGDDAKIKGNVICQIGLFGLLPEPGKGRKRLTNSVVADSAGGIAAVIDSTTTDPSMSIGQKDSAPLVLNAGEGQGVWLRLYPGDNSINFEDSVEKTSWRDKAGRLIRHLKRIGK